MTIFVLAAQDRANGVLALAQTIPNLAKLVEASILCYKYIKLQWWKVEDVG